MVTSAGLWAVVFLLMVFAWEGMWVEKQSVEVVDEEEGEEEGEGEGENWKQGSVDQAVTAKLLSGGDGAGVMTGAAKTSGSQRYGLN
jgi:hypothetical protein